VGEALPHRHDVRASMPFNSLLRSSGTVNGTTTSHSSVTVSTNDCPGATTEAGSWSQTNQTACTTNQLRKSSLTPRRSIVFQATLACVEQMSANH